MYLNVLMYCANQVLQRKSTPWREELLFESRKVLCKSVPGREFTARPKPRARKHPHQASDVSYIILFG